MVTSRPASADTDRKQPARLPTAALSRGRRVPSPSIGTGISVSEAGRRWGATTERQVVI